MIKRIVILLLALCTSIMVKSHQIMNADMAFTLVAGIGFLIMAAWTCFHSSIPDEEKFRVFMKFIPEPLVVYMLIGGTAYALSAVSDLDFWMICRFAAIFYVILGNHTIRYKKQILPDVTRYFESSIDGSSRKESTTFHKNFAATPEGIKSFDEFLTEMSNSTSKEDASFAKFLKALQDNPSMSITEFEEHLKELFG